MSDRDKTVPKNPYIIIGSLCIIAVAFIIIYGIWRCKNEKFVDPLTFTLIGGPEMKDFTDGWGLIHFTFYALLTYFFPQYYLQIFFVGVGWEVIESMSKGKPFYVSSCNVTINTDHSDFTEWWSGRWQDIVMNTLGQLFGYSLRKLGVSWIIFPIMYVSIFVAAFFKAGIIQEYLNKN